MVYHWQAVLKVNPSDRTANIYKELVTGGHNNHTVSPESNIISYARKSAPANAPDWAVYFRTFQTYRERIITWWRHHQRSDGQVGGGWNDDTLVFSSDHGREGGYSDMILDSDPDARILYNNVFDGFDKTNYFKDGYCRIYPIDRLHNGDFVRDRYRSLVYNLGDPKCAVWAMEEAWHWGKPEKTPENYGDGRAFLFGKDVLEWYWGKRRINEPYQLTDLEGLTDELRKAAIVNNDITLWRFTEAWVHTDDQTQYGSASLMNMLLGGWSVGKSREDSNVNITLGVGWIKGGGPELARYVDYSGTEGLTVSMYSFDAFDRKVTARLYRLDPGVYSVTLWADENGDGKFEHPVLKREQSLRRFDRLELTVPPKVPVRLLVQQMRAEPEPDDLPDLATSPYYIKKKGNSLTVTVHNIGSATSGPFTVSLVSPDGRELGVKQVDLMPGAEDFVPKTVDVTFNNLPDYAYYKVHIDRENKVKEIFEENNYVDFVPET